LGGGRGEEQLITVKTFSHFTHKASQNMCIIRQFKSRRTTWVGHITLMGETRNAYKILVVKPEQTTRKT